MCAMLQIIAQCIVFSCLKSACIWEADWIGFNAAQFGFNQTPMNPNVASSRFKCKMSMPPSLLSSLYYLKELLFKMYFWKGVFLCNPKRFGLGFNQTILNDNLAPSPREWGVLKYFAVPCPHFFNLVFNVSCSIKDIPIVHFCASRLWRKQTIMEGTRWGGRGSSDWDQILI